MRLNRLPVLATLIWSVSAQAAAPGGNQLSSTERSQGWQLLFDGSTTTHWIDPARQRPPGDAWKVEDGSLKAVPHPRITEDLLSQDTYRDFELEWDWKIAPGGNSGVKYRIQKLITLPEEAKSPTAKKFEDRVQQAATHEQNDARGAIKPGEKAQVYVVGFEYQMIDNSRHPDARHGPAYQTGALYSILGPSEPASKPAGEFNHSLLIVRGGHVEHWLNGVKVVDTSLDTQQLKDNLAHRWGSASEVYHLLVDQPLKDCHISLQNHGDAAWFRNIKVKRLD